MKLFVALDLPESVDLQLSWLGGGIHGARWEPADKLHLTLRYLGEVDGGERKHVEAALARVDVDPFELAIKGVGHFPPRGQPRSVWAGVDDDTHVHRLHDRISHALDAIGIDGDRRKFAPHVTLARLRHSPEQEVAEFLARNALLSTPPWTVDAFALYSSTRGPRGSKYAIERVYPLGRAAGGV